VTASEFAFLAMGLLLGLAAGAALVEVVRARPPAPREVRVTMSTDAVPRRSSTLAESTQAMRHAEPARGGPADRREDSAPAPVGSADRRTAVLSPSLSPRTGGIPISGGTDPLMGALRASAAAAATAALRTPTATAVLDHDPAMDAGRQVGAGGGSGPTGPIVAGDQAVARLQDGGHDADVGGHAIADGPCAEVRRVADERCELATRSRDQAGAAEASLRAAQRAYDDHEARSDAAQLAADPRAIRQAKDAAQERFRAARDRAATTDELEAAARTWLSEVNDINAAMREATSALARERAAAQELGANLERLALEADAARISAETAEAACLAAREALAACDEETAAGTAVPHLPAAVHRPGGPFPLDDAEPDAESLPAALAGDGGTPRIFLLLRGDRLAMATVVGALAGDDPDERRRWQLALAGLVDAIIADAIEAGTLEFPDEHSLWGPFTVAQDRDIVRALASLGYRFDGLGGWLDERFPSQRDLSLALGYAGLDPMRLRQWPNETEMARLFEAVTVAADEHLAGAAGDLTLGELVSMLGRRADGLADLWNQWGHVRPLLLEDA